MREEFLFSASYKSAIEQAIEQGMATAEDKLAWYDGIISYALSGAEPQFKGVCAILWSMAGPSIDKANAEWDKSAAAATHAAARSEKAKRMANARWQKVMEQHDAHSMMHTASMHTASMHAASMHAASMHAASMHAASEEKKKEKEAPNVSLPPTPPITSLPKEINKEKEGGEDRVNFSCSSNAEHPVATPPKRELSKEFLSDVVGMWNATCVPHMPKLIDIRGTRKDKLRLRLMELGGGKEETDWLAWLRALFDKCARTPFLWGKNNRGWRCDFGWLVANDTNWRQVMEGRYDGTPPKGYDTGVILTDNDPHKFDNEEEKWK